MALWYSMVWMHPTWFLNSIVNLIISSILLWWTKSILTDEPYCAKICLRQSFSKKEKVIKFFWLEYLLKTFDKRNIMSNIFKEVSAVFQQRLKYLQRLFYLSCCKYGTNSVINAHSNIKQGVVGTFSHHFLSSEEVLPPIGIGQREEPRKEGSWWRKEQAHRMGRGRLSL